MCNDHNVIITRYNSFNNLDISNSYREVSTVAMGMKATMVTITVIITTITAVIATKTTIFAIFIIVIMIMI